MGCSDGMPCCEAPPVRRSQRQQDEDSLLSICRIGSLVWLCHGTRISHDQDTSIMSAERILQDRITENLIVEKRGAAGWITFNDPGRHNAVSFAMWDAIPQALQAFAEDP